MFAGTLLTPPQCRASFVFHLALPLTLALVVQLFASPNRKLHLDQSVLQVELGWDYRQATLTGGLLELLDLFAMQQQLTPAHWLVIHDVAVRVLADVGVYKPSLIGGHFTEGILELDFSIPGRFDLGSGEDQSRLHAVGQKVIVSRSPIVA